MGLLLLQLEVAQGTQADIMSAPVSTKESFGRDLYQEFKTHLHYVFLPFLNNSVRCSVAMQEKHTTSQSHYLFLFDYLF